MAMLAMVLWVSPATAQSITNPIAQLKNHVLGTATLTAAQIVTQGNSIQTNIRQVGTNSVALAAALDLVDTYDTTVGALFTTTATKNGFTRDGAGFELAQALFDLQQGLLDYAYTPANLVTYFSLLNNTKFDTCAYFPGAVTPPASTNTGYAVLINATQSAAWGAPVMYESNAARRPTGCYLAPGSIAYVTVPPALVNQGYSVRVGAHSWDLSAKDTPKRLDRVSLVYSITSATMRIANPLGGGIYIEVPYKKTNGIVTVGITNVVRSPFFSATSFHPTTAAEWLAERTNPGKWADFESDKFMMQVPRSWIYNYTNAASVMADWDAAMDAVSDLMGLPQIRSKTVLYIQVDVLYRSTANAPGYPQSNDPYSPNTSESGNKDHWLLTGPHDAPWTVLHELGHGELFTKFTGEVESAVNLLDVAANNRKFGVAIGTALGNSIGDDLNASINLNQAALSWIMVDKFRAGQAMDSTDMAYQHRGHGKYVEIAYLFGWGALSNFWHSVHVDYINGIDYPENSDPTDSRILRMSKAAGVDLRPLIHMWGVLPVNATTLKTSIQNAGLKPSALIYDRLKVYQSVVPLTLSQFKNHYWAIDSSMPANDKTWYQTMSTNFTPDIGYASIAALQNIVDLYFPDGAPLSARWNGAVSPVWNTSTANWRSLNTGAVTNYVDVSPGDGVLFDDTLFANPAVTLSTTVTPVGVMFSNNTSAYSISGTGKIAGKTDIIKRGTGMVTLNTSNTFTGDISVSGGTLVMNGVNLSCGNTTISSNAVVRSGKTGALGIGTITVGTAQTDTCRLELTGGVTVTNALAFFKRNSGNNVAAHFLNVSGTNILSPPTDLPYGTGGNVLSLQSDSGRLVLTAGVNVTASAPRYTVLQGASGGEVQGPISANGALLKLGTGEWTLSGVSPMNGPITVSNGTLVVNGTLSSTANVLAIEGGTLAGKGVIAGAVIVRPAGRLAPGTSTGTLTINNSLTLQGTAVMEIGRNGTVLTNDLVAGIGALTYGGTLIVTNLGGSPLQAGDSFQLFAANSRAGAFASIVYPAGCMFTNSLATDGRIRVVSMAPPPEFSRGGVVKLPDGNFSLTATGVIGGPYRLWASANVGRTLITNAWTLLSSGTVATNPFTINDLVATNFPQRFYQFSNP